MFLHTKEYKLGNDTVEITHELEYWLNKQHYSPTTKDGRIIELNNIPFEKILANVVDRGNKTKFGTKDQFLFELAMQSF